MPTVSVIVPAYNAEKTILETIASLQNQTFRDFELIVINDGSTDATVERLQTIQDDRLKVFSYDNGGLPVARNRGMAQASGEFLTFIDADDLWTPDKLETQVAALQQHPEAGVAYSWTVFVNQVGEFLHKPDPIYWQGNVHARLLLGNFISSGSNIMVRRSVAEAAGEFDPTLKSAEDWDYYLRLAALSEFVLVPHYQILYRRSSQSMTSKVDVMEHYILLVLERAYQNAPAELQGLKNQSLSNVHLFLAHLCLAFSSSQSDAKKAGQHLAKAIRLYPKNLGLTKTQRMMLKFAIVRLVPYRVASLATRTLGKLFPASNRQGTSLANN